MSWNHSCGYIWVRCPDHPRASTRGYVPEQILVVEKALGHYLPLKAQVHHVNGDRKDNRPDNLVVCEDRAYHNYLHQRQRAFDACGHADWLKCPYCKTYDDPKNLYVHNGKSRHNFHRDCHATVAYQRKHGCEAPVEEV